MTWNDSNKTKKPKTWSKIDLPSNYLNKNINIRNEMKEAMKKLNIQYPTSNI